MSKMKRMKVVTLLGTCLVGVSCWLTVPALASATLAPSPAWTVTSRAEPTNFAAGSTYGSSMDQYQITVTNTGGAPSDGTAITVEDTLPPEVLLDAHEASGSDQPFNAVNCSNSGQVVTCTDADSTPLQPDASLTITIPVDVGVGATGTVVNSVSVSGGVGAKPAVTATETTPISTTPAPFGLQSASVRSLNADGSPDTQAGSHPYQVVTSLAFNTLFHSDGAIMPSGNLDRTILNLPPGLVGAATAIPTCSEQALDVLVTGSGVGGCPTDTQVGVVYASLATAVPETIEVPVYNMAPPAGEPAEFAFLVQSSVEHINWSVRSGGDYGLTSALSATNETLPVYGATVDLWGNPADSSHDTQRFAPQGATFGIPGGAGGAPLPYGANPLPLITNPTSCGSSLPIEVSVTSWQNPNQPVEAGPLSLTDGEPLTGCGSLPFDPTMTVQPTTSLADSPSGLDVDLSMPQAQNVTGVAEANLKNVRLSLPPGVTVNPSAASGLTGCSLKEIGIDDGNAPTCPDSSKIGTVTITSPLISDELTGSVYVATPTNNPFGSLLAIYVTAYADGVWVKLAGRVLADPITGQLVTTFENNPQLPFSDLELDFFGGDKGILATPQQLGTYTTTADLTPWSGEADSAASDSFSIGSRAVSSFAPSFTAGTANAQAGAYSPFSALLTRTDTDQNLAGLTVKLPEGLLAKLAGVSECSDAQLAHASAATAVAETAEPSCPAGSQVGTVTTGAGTGPDPFFLQGKAYLTGPYKGAPYGLDVVVPVLAGPYDLGTVVVRQALEVDPITAQVTDVSDPFPTILQGIPLDIRRVDVDVNRPDFTVNPTDCNPTAVSGTATSTRGATAALSSRFQVGGCGDLAFGPGLKITLEGATGRLGHPALDAVLTPKAGEANIGRAQVNLPHGEFLDQSNLDKTCTKPVLLEGRCPASSVYGRARAFTPLLERPLEGNVYLVGGYGYKLPALVADLNGQIRVTLVGKIDSGPNKGIRATFGSVPDAPISRFELQMKGGKKYGLLENSEPLCRASKQERRAIVRLTGQNAKVSQFEPLVQNGCGKARSKSAGGKKG